MSRGTATAVPFNVWANGKLVDAGEGEGRGAGR
jgi:hypothetical protein